MNLVGYLGRASIVYAGESMYAMDSLTGDRVLPPRMNHDFFFCVAVNSSSVKSPNPRNVPDVK